MNTRVVDRPISRAIRASDMLRASIRELAGGEGLLLVHEERSWASATFSGTRHKLTIAFDGEDAVQAGEIMIALLPEQELVIPGQLVADSEVMLVEQRALPAPRLVVELELLLLDDDR